jgi:hypothetical protein
MKLPHTAFVRPPRLPKEVLRLFPSLQNSRIGEDQGHRRKVLPLSEARQAHELSESGHNRRKIVLKVA